MPPMKGVLRELVGITPRVEQQRRILHAHSTVLVANDVTLTRQPGNESAYEALVKASTMGDFPLNETLPRIRRPGAMMRALPARSSQLTPASSQTLRPTSPMNGTAIIGTERPRMRLMYRLTCCAAIATTAVLVVAFTSTTKTSPTAAITKSAPDESSCRTSRPFRSTPRSPASSSGTLAATRSCSDHGPMLAFNNQFDVFVKSST